MSLKSRIRRLAQETLPAETAFGVQFGTDGPIRVNGREMTEEAFYARYPRGQHLLIRFTPIGAGEDQLEGNGTRAPVEI